MEIEKETQQNKQINTLWLHLYCFALGFGGLNLAFAISGNNQTANIIAAKFQMDAEEKLFWNSLINVCSVVGMGLGAFLGGLIIPIGRRKTLIIFNLIAIVSICLSLV